MVGAIMNEVSFDLEQQHQGYVAGIDEAGRGPLMGPVVAAAAVFMDYGICPTGVNDSKRLTAQQREHIFQKLLQLQQERWFYFGIGQASAGEIDQINIRQATKLAMARAFGELWSTVPQSQRSALQTVLVDGNFTPDLSKFPLRRVDWVIKGDAKSLSIAAASILAKVTRDRWVEALARQFPMYDWQHNKGYGTVKHLQAIQQYGLHVEHRRSFGPCKQLPPFI